MRTINKVALGSVFLLVGSVAFAQESEYQEKMQEDLDGYKAQIISNCGSSDKLTIKWNGKLGSNPRETKDGDYSSNGTLCTSALDGVSGALSALEVEDLVTVRDVAEMIQRAEMARRIAAILLLEPQLDANYAAVKAAAYGWLG